MIGFVCCEYCCSSRVSLTPLLYISLAPKKTGYDFSDLWVTVVDCEPTVCVQYVHGSVSPFVMDSLVLAYSRPVNTC